MREAGSDAVGDAGDDHPAIAVAHQDHVAQVLVFDDVDDILDVGREANLRVGEMGALAHADQGRRENLLAGVLQ